MAEVSLKALVASSAWAVHASMGAVVDRRPTGEEKDGRKVVRFWQAFRPRRTILGRGRAPWLIVEAGLEPPPPVDDPLNAAYPGPYAEGDYVLFLRSDPAAGGWRLVGGWQGLYPVIGGRLVALEGYGTPELHGLTVAEAAMRLRTVKRSP
ncbi:MAG: hypothetical protein HSCHL_2313 [Hydrogenibacillus schlegelii]|uniref:Uncharacterized protein n=1 Tax=Hydrogenibacillus schlegelii TaxID=1484 RepID=A0A2T5GEW1_HYDSH|nr:hypothetical protein [Hydrogenibacillus schlegelii]PTQ54722.1 MAG: hypothetical protein HSCHL_2313 [Hydrogenibacillus schlegelii]